MAEPFDAVTGGAGFIGSHLAEALLARGGKVRVIDDFSTGKRENLNAALGGDAQGRLEVVEADVRQGDRLKDILDGVRRVFHLAAMTSVEESVRDPLKMNSVNLDGTLAVLEAAKRAGAEKLVFASSTAVYGDSEELPKRETGQLKPLSPYAVTKLAGELYCQVFSSLYAFPTVCLRFFNVYGPRQDPSSQYAAVVPRFIDRILRGLPPVIFGDGLQTRDFVHVRDVVAACLLASESAATGVSLNVASGRSVDLRELAAHLNAISKVDLPPVHQEARQGEVRHSSASIVLARELIGYAPQVSLKDGLATTLNWFRASNRTI